MTEQQVENLILQREGVCVEFKTAGNGPQADTYESICAFLNRYGGDMLLGVTDDGDVVGVDESRIEEMKRQLVNVASDANQMNPPMVLFPMVVTCRGKTLIYVRIPQSAEVHRWKGVCFDRAHEADVKVTGTDAIAQMYIRKQRVYTEQKVFPVVGVGDMRLDLLPRVRNLARSARSDHPWLGMDDEGILRSAHFLSRDWETGKEGFNAAGVLCLGSDEVIQGLFPAYKTDALLKRVNLDRYDDRDLIRTNLIESYDRIIAFGEKQLDDKFFMEDGIRISLRSKILREAVGNLLIHREYSSARTGRFIVEDNAIVVDNPNKAIAHGFITPRNMNPVAKNPIIANFFQQIGRADDLGSGVRNLFKYVKAYSGRDPVLDEDDIFTLTIPLNANASDPIKTSVDPINDPIKFVDDPINDPIAERVLREIRKCPGRNRDSLAGVLGVSVETIKRAIAELKRSERVEHRGSKKMGGYYVKEAPHD